MLIDWFTVAAQALNLIILVWLLKRFLYQPILNAIDAREKHIEQVLTDAAQTQKQADAANKQWHDKNAAIESERETLLTKARTDAEQEKQRLIVQASQAADELGEKRQLALQQEQQDLQIHLNSYARKEVFAIARKTLHDLADASLEQTILEKFISTLSSLSDADKKSINTELINTQLKATIYSSGELNETQQKKLSDALNTVLQANIALIFEVSTESSHGITLKVGDQNIAWTIDNYLQSFEQGVSDLITKKSNLGEKKSVESKVPSETAT